MSAQSRINQVVSVVAFLIAALLVWSFLPGGSSDFRYEARDLMGYGLDSTYADIAANELNKSFDSLYKLKSYRDFMGDAEGETAFLRGQMATTRAYTALDEAALDSLAHLQLDLLGSLAEDECAKVGLGDVQTDEWFAFIQRLEEDEFRALFSMNMQANLAYFSGPPPAEPTSQDLIDAWDAFGATLSYDEARRFQDFLDRNVNSSEDMCWLQRQVFESIIVMSEPQQSTLLKSIVAEIESGNASAESTEAY